MYVPKLYIYRVEKFKFLIWKINEFDSFLKLDNSRIVNNTNLKNTGT